MEPALTILRGGDVHAPDHLGQADIIIAGGRIAGVGGDVAGVRGDAAGVGGDVAGVRGDAGAAGFVDVVDVDGLLLAPGLVDSHVHFLGGGGGDGYDSRAPELQLSDFTANGVTTALAPLGIDPVSRSLEGLLAKSRALTDAGITACFYTGGFRRPLLSLTGSPWRDAYLIPEVRGVKLAIGVERAPSHATRELVDLARELLWVERATGKRLVLHVHLGTLASGHELVQELAGELEREQGDAQRLVVTHCNRTAQHVETAVALSRLGAWTDMTTMISVARGMPGSLSASEAVLRVKEAGAELGRVTLSTDGNGSVPERAADGSWAPYRTHMDSLLGEIRALIAAGFSMSDAFALASAKPAASLGLERKGEIRVGADADIIALDSDLNVREVFARGRRVVAGGRPLVLGRYERRDG